MGKKRLDYATIYTLLQTSSVEEVAEVTGVHIKNVKLIKNIGDAILMDKPKPKDARPLDKFTPREMFAHLKKLGFKWKPESIYFEEIKRTYVEFDKI